MKLLPYVLSLICLAGCASKKEAAVPWLTPVTAVEQCLAGSGSLPLLQTELKLSLKKNPSDGYTVTYESAKWTSTCVITPSSTNLSGNFPIVNGNEDASDLRRALRAMVQDTDWPGIPVGGSCRFARQGSRIELIGDPFPSRHPPDGTSTLSYDTGFHRAEITPGK